MFQNYWKMGVGEKEKEGGSEEEGEKTTGGERGRVIFENM